MSKPTIPQDPAETLRQRAEAQAGSTQPSGEGLTPEETQKLLHELRVHQIELEVQNEELRHTQAELERARERYFDLYNFSPVGHLTLNDQGKILEANLTLSTMLGVPKTGLINHLLTPHLHPDDANAFYLYRTRLFRLQEPQELDCRLVRTDGSQFWARLRGWVGPVFGAGIQARLAVADITERKLAEEVIQHSEQRYRELFTRAEEGILILSTEGKILEVNQAFARMHGYRPEEMAGMNIRELDLPESVKASPERLKQLLAGEVLTFEVEHYHQDGHPFPLEVSASLIPNLGQPQLLCFHRDISARKRLEGERRELEAQLLQTQKMDSLGSLAGGVAHDMNNALTAILASAETQIENLPHDAPTHAAFETIIKASIRARTLVKSLLAFARKGLTETQNLDLNELVREEVQLLEHSTLAQIRFVMDLAPDLRPISGDTGALSHVLMNLCVNALDAMEGLPGERRLTLRTRNAGDKVELEVEDTGTGMSKEVQEKALEPFFTTKPQGKGTGLGLSIVYGTVKAHSGQLEIHSQPGQGTRILLRFPASTPVSPFLEEAPTSAGTPQHPSLKVLLVDDDELVQSSISLLLEVLGHTVTVAPSGEDALARLEAGLACDVVILDLNMPGLGGEGTLPLIRALRPELPVVLATGRLEPRAVNLVQAYPLVTLLPKPFALGEIRWHLEQLS